MNKKKILFVQETLEGGGAEKVLVDILNNFDYEQFSVDLLLIRKSGIYLKNINCNVNLFYLYKKSKVNFINKVKDNIYKNFLIKNFSNLLFKSRVNKKYDCVIAFLEGPSSQFVSKLKNNSKKILWVHSDLRRLRRLKLSEEKVVYSNSDKIICVSNEVKKGLNELYPDTTNKSQVIYNLIDTENIIRKSNEKIEFEFRGINIIAVGRLIESKRFDLIIRAHKEVIDRGIDHNLIILGEGPLEENLIQLTKKLNVEESVKFLGFINNPYPYIKSSDVYIMASDYEGLPLVICEALTLKKIIISTKCTGPSELLCDGAGILVKCGEYEEIAEKIINVLTNQIDNIEIEEKMDSCIELFSVDNILKKIYSNLNM